MEELGANPLPAIGFAAGIERLMLLMENSGCPFPEPEKPRIYIAGMDENTRFEAFKITQELRTKGIYAETDLMERSVKAQFKYADKLGAEYVAVIGQTELSDGAVNVKKMSDGTQSSVKITEIYTYLSKNQ